MPLANEVIILKGSGRGSAYLICHRGIDVIPEHDGPKSGKRLIGLRVNNGNSVELYVEAGDNGAYREFYYDCTISLQGPWQNYQDQRGFYDVDPFQNLLIEENTATSVANDPEAASAPAKDWDELDDAYSEPITQVKTKVSIAKQTSTRRVEVVRLKAERKLALDKDI